MKTYTAIIVEDERLPRLSLKQKIETYHTDVRVIDCCDDAPSAMKSILKHRPDILFLDIQLPGENSLWLLEQLKSAIPLPHIIFTTAYNEPEFLMKAIKFSAIDYLLKPVDILQLAEAMTKIREKDAVIDIPDNRYSFRTVTGTLYAHNSDILYCRADGNYSQLYLLQGSEMIFERLGDIEDKLDKNRFIRAGRSLIVNREYIYKVDRKRNLCILKTPSGATHQVEVSVGGMEIIQRKIPINK